MKKLNIETIKTIIITILITGIIAFIGGMQYQKNQTEQVKAEAATIVKNVKVEVSKQQRRKSGNRCYLKKPQGLKPRLHLKKLWRKLVQAAATGFNLYLKNTIGTCEL